MIRYKVIRLVGLGDGLKRFSCYADGIFRKEYIEGSTVTANKGTDGLYVFDLKKNAVKFIEGREGYFTIIKVRTIGRGKKILNMCANQRESFLIEFWKHSPSFKISAPKGTLAYKSVKVLE